jgi:hypothetical protein
VSVTVPGLLWLIVVLVVNVVSERGQDAARVVGVGRVRVLIRATAPPPPQQRRRGRPEVCGPLAGRLDSYS